MEALKAMKAKMQQEREAVAASKAEGASKYTTKAELEAARLTKLREEEERERVEKEKKRKVDGGAAADAASARPAKKGKEGGDKDKEKPPALLMSRAEVIRRLRALGQPATLFGEDNGMREARLIKAEREMKVDDDTVGGQQANLMLELARAGKGEKAALAKAKAQAEAEAAEAEAAQRRKLGPDGAPGVDSAEEAPIVAKDPTMEAFEKAAAALAARRTEEAMCVEDRIEHYLKRWMAEWDADLESRPEEIKNSGSGHQTTLQFRQTEKYFEPLFERLKHRLLHEELRAGIWMIISAMKQRNYLSANDIYLKLAIGNAPWPIGVTSVGIHERAAREKISHVSDHGNASGAAHIMNDEASRKYFQGIKRLITFVQRAYPTDPSRSVNFQTAADFGRGCAGGGSDKLALIEAEKRGEDWRALGLEEAPHYMGKDGSVNVPIKWKYIIGRAQEECNPGGASGSGSGGEH
ncbi:hypothetical protein FOA52_007279 [Chlamydomonas sp. UWO 241]|nr:hypothetical protein FOA52_007279 [Chlamydomonas sp. UWO 241]